VSGSHGGGQAVHAATETTPERRFTVTLIRSSDETSARNGHAMLRHFRNKVLKIINSIERSLPAAARRIGGHGMM
jgi:hypothetical protein